MATSVRNRTGTAVIVLPEIYGLNEHIKDVRTQLIDLGVDALCSNLLPGMRPYGYHEATEAYRNFQTSGGFPAARATVHNLIRQVRARYQRLILLGYSVGATVAWLLSEEETLVDGIVGYYGSRIRDYASIRPACAVLLHFARQEAAFDPVALAPVLACNVNTTVQLFDAGHGFADRYSPHYCPSSSLAAWQLTCAFIRKLSQQPAEPDDITITDHGNEKWLRTRGS